MIVLREARSVACLRHPSIVPVYEVGQVESVPYLVSEFVQGMTIWMTQCNWPSVQSGACTRRQTGGRRPSRVIFNW